MIRGRSAPDFQFTSPVLRKYWIRDELPPLAEPSPSFGMFVA